MEIMYPHVEDLFLSILMLRNREGLDGCLVCKVTGPLRITCTVGVAGSLVTTGGPCSGSSG